MPNPNPTGGLPGRLGATGPLSSGYVPQLVTLPEFGVVLREREYELPFSARWTILTECKMFTPEGFYFHGLNGNDITEAKKCLGSGLWPNADSTVSFASGAPTANSTHAASTWVSDSLLLDSEAKIMRQWALGYIAVFMDKYVPDAFARKRFADRTLPREDLNAPLNLGAITMPYIRLVGNMIGLLSTIKQLSVMLYTNDSLRYLVKDWVESEIDRLAQIVLDKMDRVLFPPYFAPMIQAHYGVEMYADNMLWVTLPVFTPLGPISKDKVIGQWTNLFPSLTVTSANTTANFFDYGSFMLALGSVIKSSDVKDIYRKLDMNGMMKSSDGTIDPPGDGHDYGNVDHTNPAGALEKCGIKVSYIKDALHMMDQVCDVLHGRYGRNPNVGMNFYAPGSGQTGTGKALVELMLTDLYRAPKLWSEEFGWVPASSFVSAAPKEGGYFKYRFDNTPYYWLNQDENQHAMWRVVTPNPYLEVTSVGSAYSGIKPSDSEVISIHPKDLVALPLPHQLGDDWLSQWALRGFHGIYATPFPSFPDDEPNFSLGMFHDVGSSGDDKAHILRLLRGITHDQPARMKHLSSVIKGGNVMSPLVQSPFVDSMYSMALMPYSKYSSADYWTFESFSEDVDMRSWRNFGFMGNKTSMEVDTPGLLYTIELSHLFKVPAPFPAAYNRDTVR